MMGNNPSLKAQDDVDVMAIDKSGTKGIFMECKCTSSPTPYSEYEDHVNITKAFLDIKEKNLNFISRLGYTDSVKHQAKLDGALLLELMVYLILGVIYLKKKSRTALFKLLSL